jgi:hypothetical protein
MMNKIRVFLAVLALFNVDLHAENIDPYNDDSQYAYGENIGWMNFEPDTGDGVQVECDMLTGFVWAENIGWISMSCENTGSCGTVDYGVTNDGWGNLAGFAWAENVGWISFSCDNTTSCGMVDYGVTIDADGNFDGWAYGENIGWIHLASITPGAYDVQACVVTFDDLQNFVGYWLSAGARPADLDGENDGTDLEDYAIFSSYWQDFCPDGWLLK